MNYAMLLILHIMVLPLLIAGITVSPDYAFRNYTPSSHHAPSRQRHVPKKLPNIDRISMGSAEHKTTNQTDRYRRLIPYMTVYFPPSPNDYSGSHNGQAQQYTFMPVSIPSSPIQAPKNIIPLHQQSQQQSAIGPPSHVQTQSQLHHQQSRPIIYTTTKLNSNPHQSQQQQQHQQQHQQQQKHLNYLSQSPQLSGIIYNARHPTNKPSYMQKIQSHTQAPLPVSHSSLQIQSFNSLKYHTIQPQTYKNHHLTPFLPSNKLPGYFTPINYNEHNYETTAPVKHSPPQQQQPQHVGSPTYQRPASSYSSNNQPNYIIVKSTPAPKQVYYQSEHKQTPIINHVMYSDKHVPSGGSTIVKQQIVYKDNDDNDYPSYDQKEYQQYVTPSTPVLHKEVKHEYAPMSVSTVAPPPQHPPLQSIVLSTPVPVYTTYHPHNYEFKMTTPKPYYRTMSPPPYVPKPQFIQHPQPQQQPLPPVRQHLTETTHSQQSPHINYATKTLPKNYYEPYKHYVNVQQIKNSPIYKPMHTTIAPKLKLVTPSPQPEIEHEEHQVEPQPEYNQNSLSDILKKLQDSNHLPHTLTPDNIDNSIKTLVKILNNLKQTQTAQNNPPQSHQTVDYDYNETDNEDELSGYNSHPDSKHIQQGPNSGKPGIDYPNLHKIPETSFSCKEQRYKGFFGDPETNCQVWHYCDLNGGKASFLCPNGTIFSQVALTCDWWFNVKCSSTAQLYVLNERLYKYILPFTPKFPEDYSGPLVDKYLALKFEEMEEKMRRQKSKGKESNPKENTLLDEENETPSTAAEEEEEVVEHTTEVEKEPPAHSEDEYQYITTEAQQITPVTSLPPIPQTHVESQRLEVIEIKPDGSTGHLTRNTAYADEDNE